MTGPVEPGPPRRANSARRSTELAHAHIRSLIHDAVAPLAARVDALEQRPGGGGVSDEHAAEHAHLKTALDKLAAKAEDGAGESWWLPDLDPEVRAQREDELRTWVDEVLTVVWPHPGRLLRVHRCWFEHLDVRYAVHGAWMGWVGAYRAPGRRREAIAAWLSRDLPAMARQVKDGLPEPHESCEDHPRVRSTDHGDGVQPDLPGR